MSADPRQPWWSSAAEQPQDDAEPTGAGSPADGAADDPDRTAGAADAPHEAAGCGWCPVCSTVRALQDTHPELVDHLTEAARHLAAAARTLLEPPVPPPPAPWPPERRGGVRSIPVDDDPEQPR